MAIVDNSSEDIVKRITQRINDFQRSTVTFGEDCEVVMPAARADSILGDDIKHSSAWAALAGAIVGGILAYGPTVLSFIPGPIGVAARVGMFLFDVADTVSGFVSDKSFSERAADSVSQWIESFSPASHGKLIKGSTFLQINNLPAAIATPAEEVLQSVRCDNHSLQEVGEGSETVFIDGTPAARQGDRVVCGAKISTGSPNVFFGSGQALYSPIKPEFNSVQKALLVAVEFVIPPTALFSKGIGKAITQAGKSLATRGAHVGATVASRAKNLYKKSVKRFKISGNTQPYSHIPDSKSVGAGKKFTKLQKEKIIKENMKKNNGVVRSDMSGEVLIKPSKSQKGVTPPDNEWQIDHIKPKSKGGTNSYSNAQVLSRKENRQKSNK